jgi:hypothetical protein
MLEPKTTSIPSVSLYEPGTMVSPTRPDNRGARGVVVAVKADDDDADDGIAEKPEGNAVDNGRTADVLTPTTMDAVLEDGGNAEE